MDDAPPLLFRQMLGKYAIDVLAMGQASGALEALVAAPGTPAEIADRSGLDLRNVDQWLRAMTTAGHVHHDDGVFSLEGETLALLGPDFPVDVRAVLSFVHTSFGEPFRAATEAMRTGSGVPTEVYADLGRAVGPLNSRVYRAALVEEWIAAAPALRERLDGGGRIADVACGNADAAAVMATAFPRSTVTGYDPGTPPDAHADVPNLRIVRDPAADLPSDGSFDLVTCLDAFHHLGDPAAFARVAHAALRPGGVFLVAESSLSGDVDVDKADPLSLIVQAGDLLYCMQENLANGGDGSTPSIGLGWVDDALAAAGFATVDHLDSATGYRIFLAAR